MVRLMLFMGFDGVRANYVRSVVFSCVHVRKGVRQEVRGLKLVCRYIRYYVPPQNSFLR
jgi:hypothetical protein